MTLCTFLWIAAMACSTDAIPTAPSGPEQNQLVSTISIDPSDAVIQPDDREVLKAQVRGARGQIVNGRDITWTTSDPSIIDIDASGNVLAVNEGTATITARHKTVAGSATVDVRGDVVEILFSEVPDLDEGEARVVNVTYRYSNGAERTAQRVKWWSEDREIVRIDGDGELLGIGEGSVNIYAAGRGQSASSRVRVGKKEVAEVVVLAPETDIEVGERRELWAEVYTTTGDRLYRKLAWSSSNTSVATVDRHAGVTGIKPGTATITATVAGVRGSADVTIVSSLSSGSTAGSDGGSGGSGSSGQSVPADVTDLAVVDTGLNYVTLSFTRVDDGTGSDAKYEFRFDVAQDFDWSRAQVAVKGNCDDLSTGTPGQKATCHIEGLLAATDYRVQVVPYRVSGGETIYGELSNVANGRTDDPAVLVDVVPSAFSVDVGGTKQMTSSVTDEFGNPLSANVTWTSTSSGVASVSSSGMVTANAAGSATIRATALSTSGSAAATIVQPASDDGSGGSGGSATSPPPSAGWAPPGTPVCDEDFTRYASFDDWRARALCGWNIDQVEAWGPNNTQISSRGLMYRHRTDPNPCRDATVGQATTRISPSPEIWMEFVVEWGPNIDFSPNTQTGTKCGGGYKFVLTWNDRPSSQGYQRWDWIVWNHSGYEASVPGFSQMDDVPVNPGAPKVPGDASTATYPPHTVRSNLAGAPKPGQTQTYRVHFRDNRDGTFQVYAEVDGIVTHDYLTNSITDSGLMEELTLGSNRNSHAEQDQYMWWKSFKVWAR